VLLVLVGIALVTGGWDHFLVWLKTTFDFSGGTLL
jgi:cytochrome c-type biogenesis protein